jgi:PPP family 3-phenylpropionic acid transporter
MRGLELGIVSAAAPAMGIVAPTAFGVAADALALRGGLLQIACAGALISFGALAIALRLGVPLGFGGLLGAAVVIAVFRSPMTLIMDVVALEGAPRLGTTYGRLRLWGSLGFLGSALLGGALLDPADAVAFPAVCSLALAVAFACSMSLPRRAELPHAEGPRGVGRLLAEPDFRLFLVATFLAQCGQAAYDLGFTLHLADLGVPRSAIGVAWAVGTAAEVVLMAVSAPMFRSFRASRLLVWALGGAAARWALLAWVRSPAVLFALQPLHAVSFALVWLAQVMYTARRFPAHSLATAQGLFATAVGLGSVVGMVLWGPVYLHAGGVFMFAGAAAFALSAAAFALLLDVSLDAILDQTVQTPVKGSSASGE